MTTATRRLGPIDEANAALDALARGSALAVVTIIDGDDIGARILVDDTGVRGGLRDARLEDEALRVARAALADAGLEAETITLQGAAGPVRALLQVHRAPPRVVIVGAGHIAVPLARVARIAGFDVTVLDDRVDFADPIRFQTDVRVLRMDRSDPFASVHIDGSTFVVLVTRAHEHDFECLRALLSHDAPLPRYVGMIGSRRRVRAAFGALLDGGVKRERLACVRAPLGLDVRAETPDEIAVSVVAEMIAVRRAGDTPDVGAPLSARESVLDRFFPEAP